MWTLGLNFFGLSSHYKNNLMDEFYYLSKYVNFSYQDLIMMPTFERRYYMDKLISEYDKTDWYSIY
jgi:hypothetical protein